MTNFTAGSATKRKSAKARAAEEYKEGTVDEVLEWVGDDLHRAQIALAKEHASDDVRKGVVEKLERLLDQYPPLDANIDEVIAWTDGEAEYARTALEVEYSKESPRKTLIEKLVAMLPEDEQETYTPGSASAGDESTDPADQPGMENVAVSPLEGVEAPEAHPVNEQ